MKPKMNIMNQLLSVRGVLQSISQESFNYATLNKQYPIADVTEIEAKELLQSYVTIIERVVKNLNEFENKYGNTQK